MISCTVAQKLEHDDIQALVADLLMSKKKAKVWMITRNLNLGNFTPRYLILRGQGQKVRDFIADARGLDVVT